jgi:hypothetical protein
MSGNSPKRALKKASDKGAQILRTETYLWVRRNDEGCSATPQMDFLRSHQEYKRINGGKDGNKKGFTGYFGMSAMQGPIEVNCHGGRPDLREMPAGI